MEIARAALYVGPVAIAIAALLLWLAPATSRKLPDIIPFFTSLCVVLFVGAVLTVSILLRTPAPDEIDASGLALVAVIFMTFLCALGLLIGGFIARLISKAWHAKD